MHLKMSAICLGLDVLYTEYVVQALLCFVWDLIPGPLLLTLIPAWIINYIRYKVWGEITYPIPKLQRCNR